MFAATSVRLYQSFLVVIGVDHSFISVHPFCYQYFEENEEKKNLQNNGIQLFEENPVDIAYFVLPLRRIFVLRT